MADLPKIDSAGLRLAKLVGSKRVSSAGRVTIKEIKAGRGNQTRHLRHEGANGKRVVQPASGRKETR
jgi:hypothetical protein